MRLESHPATAQPVINVCCLALNVKTLGKTGGLLEKWLGHCHKSRENIKSECDYTLLEEDTVQIDHTDDDKRSLLRWCNHRPLIPESLQKNIWISPICFLFLLNLWVCFMQEIWSTNSLIACNTFFYGSSWCVEMIIGQARFHTLTLKTENLCPTSHMWLWFRLHLPD